MKFLFLVAVLFVFLQLVTSCWAYGCNFWSGKHALNKERKKKPALSRKLPRRPYESFFPQIFIQLQFLLIPSSLDLRPRGSMAEEDYHNAVMAAWWRDYDDYSGLRSGRVMWDRHACLQRGLWFIFIFIFIDGGDSVNESRFNLYLSRCLCEVCVCCVFEE